MRTPSHLPTAGDALIPVVLAATLMTAATTTTSEWPYQRPTEQVSPPPEVTDAQYQKFVRTAGHRGARYWEDGDFPAGLEQLPVVAVSWDDARAYCARAERVIRGGSYLFGTPEICRCSSRFRPYPPELREPGCGFRYVRDAERPGH